MLWKTQSGSKDVNLEKGVSTATYIMCHEPALNMLMHLNNSKLAEYMKQGEK